MSNEKEYLKLVKAVYRHEVETVSSMLSQECAKNYLLKKDKYGDNILHICIISTVKHYKINNESEDYKDCVRTARIILDKEKELVESLSKKTNYVLLKNQKNNNNLSPTNLIENKKSIKNKIFIEEKFVFSIFSTRSNEHKSNEGKIYKKIN